MVTLEPRSDLITDKINTKGTRNFSLSRKCMRGLLDPAENWRIFVKNQRLLVKSIRPYLGTQSPMQGKARTYILIKVRNEQITFKQIEIMIIIIILIIMIITIIVISIMMIIATVIIIFIPD